MKTSRLLMFLWMVAMTCITGCTPKTDAVIKTEIEAKLKKVPALSAVTVNVQGGIATIEGACPDNISKASCEKLTQEVQGVKTVINNLAVPSEMGATDTVAVTHQTTVATAATKPALADSTLEDPLANPVAEVVKKYPGVEAAVAAGVITLTGEIKKTELPGLIRTLTLLKPKRIEQKIKLVRTTARVKKTKAKATRSSRVAKKHAKPSKPTRRSRRH